MKSCKNEIRVSRSFHVEELPLFLNVMLKKAEVICHKENQALSALEAYVVVEDGVLSLRRELSLHTVQGTNGSIDASDLGQLNSLSGVFGAGSFLQ